MLIGLNATCFSDRPSGAKQRFIGVYRQLFKRMKSHQFVVFESADCDVSSWFDNPENVNFVRTPISDGSRLSRYLQGLRYWRSLQGHFKFDVFEAFHLPQVPSHSRQKFLTIHDVRGLVPGNGGVGRWVYKTVLDRSVNSSDHVITVSRTMQRDLLNLYPDLRCTVIYNGIDIEKFAAVERSHARQVTAKYEIAGDFILAVGHFESRKNYSILVDAMSHLQRKGTQADLVIVGNESGELGQIQERIVSKKLCDKVTILSGLSDNEVICLYRLASLFVFPSIYEGFGIPILEAMAAGCPMVLSDIPVFREITEDQGCYFPHDDPLALANSIKNVLSSHSVKQQLINYGNDRVRDFSFSKISSDLENVYLGLT